MLKLEYSHKNSSFFGIENVVVLKIIIIGGGGKF
jgi:hypothetical protein